MNAWFADTSYWIALHSPMDDYHSRANELRRFVDSHRIRIITTEMVLMEFLQGFCRKEIDVRIRARAATFVRSLLIGTRVEVVEQTSQQFRAILDLFERYPDKQWSPTDCASFQIMWDRNLSDALTTDHHFEQAGFFALMKSG